jgi:diguanylate cyclase (GGDEF)-like protein
MALAPEPTPSGPDPDPGLPLDWLTRAADLLQGAFEEAPVGLFLTDPAGGVRWCNATWRSQFDVWGPVPVSLDLWVHRLDDDGRRALAAGLRAVVSEGVTVDAQLRCDTNLHGALRTLRVTARRAEAHDPRSAIVGAVIAEPESVAPTSVDSGQNAALPRDGADAADDRDEGHRGNAAWAHRAMHDPLTDLPNRLLLGDHLDKALARCERDGSRVALLFFDVDRFKSINDTQGHEAGDVLLCQLAERLSAVLRPSDTVARLGGDEFVVLFDRVEDEQDAVGGGRRVTTAIETEPFRLADMDLRITVSAGIALSRPGIEPATLMREADAAMYRAKERGRARLEIYDEVLRRRAERKVDLAHRLHLAIDRDEISVHFQPCADLRSGRVVAVEALARWPEFDDTRDEFIKVAEDSGLIVPLGEKVLRRACREARRWDTAMGGRGPRVHVNLSARQLGAPGIVGSVADVLAETGIHPGSVCLEVPENALTQDPVASGAVLAGLKRLGVQLAIDDFGTASSSLPHLRDLAIDHIKIDRSFVAGLGPDPEDSAIVAAIISITHSLGMEAVAEGVETVEQVAELKALQCDVAQGHLFSRPVGGRELAPYLDHVFAV